MELVITLLVVAVGVALAVPAYDNITQRRQNTAKAEELASFLAFARSEAVKINDEVAVNLQYTNGSDWCVGAMPGNQPCDCTETNPAAADYCDIDGVAHMLDSTTQPKSNMEAYTADVTFVFDPIRGTKSADMGDLTDHSYIFRSDNTHWALQVSIGPTGRVRVCIPDDADVTGDFDDTPGFQDCTVPAPPPVLPVLP